MVRRIQGKFQRNEMGKTQKMWRQLEYFFGVKMFPQFPRGWNPIGHAGGH